MRNKAPLFFCAPGCKDDSTNAVQTSFQNSATGSDVLWPLGSRLKVRTQKADDGKITPDVWQMIWTAAQSWLEGIGSTIALESVPSNEPADIRISFREDLPNWSCIGTRATAYDVNNATMNIALGGWKDKDKMTIYTHAHIKRVAAHLFGHALGLPHATIDWHGAWKDSELDRLCGPFFAAALKADKGDDAMKNPQSIMSFDRPASLAISGFDERHGGDVIDTEARAIFRSSYPRSNRFYEDQTTVGEDILQVRTHETPCSYNVVLGLRLIDIGFGKGQYSLGIHPDPRSEPGKSIKVGFWGSGSPGADDNHIFNIIYDTLGFDLEESTVEAGGTDFGAVSGSSTGGYRIPFEKRFDAVPRVVTFIGGFLSSSAKWIRLQCYASDIDREGFSINVRSWSDTTIDNFLVWWIAHDPTNEGIRSGEFPVVKHDSQEGVQIKEGWKTERFVPPSLRKPRNVFCGFRYIEASNATNIRLRIDTMWDAKAVTAHMSSWLDSQFLGLSGSYIALL